MADAPEGVLEDEDDGADRGNIFVAATAYPERPYEFLKTESLAYPSDSIEAPARESRSALPISIRNRAMRS